MNAHKKPVPLEAIVKGSECPVCGKRSYSQGGIHPQCAVQQADAPRQKQLAIDKKVRDLAVKTASLNGAAPVVRSGRFS